MKKRILALIIVFLFLTGCSESEQNEQILSEQQKQIAQHEKEISALESLKNKLENEITDTKIESGSGTYIITINISQSHFTLDLSQHIKDAMNDINIQIPVDKQFYDSVEVGTVLDDSFRVGSLIMNGSFGNWEVKVTEKEIK